MHLVSRTTITSTISKIIFFVKEESSPTKMAMRPRGGSNAPKRAAQPRLGGVRPVYETFRPTSEWEQDDESHILNIYLPGFMKEQIKVSTEGRNTIRVRGERLVAGNKWSQFMEEFQVPENGEMNSVRAKYQGGILTIDVPKKKVEKPQESLSPDAKGIDIQKQPVPEKGQETMTKTTQPPRDQTSDLQKEMEQPRAKQGLGGNEKQPLTHTVLEKASPSVGASQSTNEESLEPQKESGDPRREHDQKDTRSVTPPKTTGTEASQDTKKESSDPIQNLIASGGQDDLKKKMSHMDEKKSMDSNELPEFQTAKKMESEKDRPIGNPEEKAEKQESYGAFIKEKYNNAAKGLAELKEERQLLVNMGISMLVIVALTAYVTYKFVSGKDKN